MEEHQIKTIMFSMQNENQPSLRLSCTLGRQSPCSLVSTCPPPLSLNPTALLAFLPVCNASPQTNTYQAILTTDGFRSYVLMLYQEGGMQWDYTRLPATNVLIGYTRYSRLSVPPLPPPSTEAVSHPWLRLI